MTCEDGIWSKATPISVHGDGVPTGIHSLEVLSWASLLGGHRQTIDQKVLISAMLNSTVSSDTKQFWWSAVLWGLLPLLEGAFPHRDESGDLLTSIEDVEMDGTPLADGFFCVMWQIKGDLEWLANGLGLEHYGALFPCPWCKATSFSNDDHDVCTHFGCSPAPMFDYSERALWRSTIWEDFGEWAREHGG